MELRGPNGRTKMKRIALFVLAMLLFVSGAALGQGTVENVQFYSQSLGCLRWIQVYLPEGYNPERGPKYPVVYFLHGAGGDHTSYSFLIPILDMMIADGQIQPVIVVKPDASCLPYNASFYTNSDLNGAFEDYIVEDVVEFVKRNYRTIPGRKKRCILGHSMGGYGAMKLALKYPDLYGGVAAHSGPVEFNVLLVVALPYIVAEYPAGPPYSWSPYQGPFSGLAFAMAAAFSPNLTNPPFYVDFPLDQNAEVIPSVFNRWLLHNPPKFAAELPPDAELSMYFDCGMMDQLGCYPQNVVFADILDQLGIAHHFESYVGGHDDQLHLRFPIALAFLDCVMNPYTCHGTGGQTKVERFKHAGLTLYQNTPNPFTQETSISFSLPASGHVSLTVYDSAGRLVEVLLDAQLCAGLHTLTWERDGAASGTYFCRLASDKSVLSRKMVIAR